MKNIITIIKISKPLHGVIAALGFLIVLTSLLQLVAPVISKFIVDEITANIAHHGNNPTRLITLIVFAFLASFAGVLTSTLSDRLGDHFAGKIRQFLTERFYDKVLTLPQSYFDGQVSGKIVNQLNRGIQTIYQFLNGASNFMLPMFLQCIFIIIILGFYNLPIALFMFILFPIYLAISYYSTVQWGKAEVEKNRIEDISRGRINEVIYNIRLVKGFTQEKSEFDSVSKWLTQINKIYAKQSWTFHKFDFARNMSLIVILFAINILVFYNTFTGALTIGEMVLILQLVNQARGPLFAMSFILTQVQQAEQGSREYLEILALPSAENYREKNNAKRITDPDISFDNVSFNYEESGVVLDNVSFKLNSKEKVAFVGHSGAGKSTIVNLIMKLYQPLSGEISINGDEYSKLSSQFIRDNIALVFQENELFSSTVAENVSYGNPKASEKEIIAALKSANAYDFVKKLPKGIDSEIGERGVKLSGGQKQRIQIARAILKGAPILILDEATSSLDAKSEKEVQEALEVLMKGKLTIIIAHRFSTIQNVDKVVVIEGGKVANFGTPKELSKQKGLYAELLNYQIEGNKKLLESFEIF
ncbi:MAG TPA: ABC transporter ATP-binding protein [Patescibacteria group bacterium]|nr:ABC transporter ATP-binding protein [Patescibacteria group bacterium]